MAGITDYDGVSGFLRSFKDGNPDRVGLFGTVKMGIVVTMNEELLADARIRGEELARLRQIAADSLLLEADSVGVEYGSPQLVPEGGR